jgi:hypothetical protein
MKIEPYSFANISTELENFRDTVTNVWNFGKYQIPFITSAPSWSGQIGEAVILAPSTGGHTQYVWFGTAWVSTWSVTL